jgi:uncharacterized protein YdiU (UPF0061 family)
MQLQFDNRFTRELPADSELDNHRRQVTGATHSFVQPTSVSQPKLVSYAIEVADLIGLSEADCQSQAFLDVFSGNKVAPGSSPYAMNYAGHQFGNFAGQLGDGRAIVLGEVAGIDDQLWTLQLKGAGPTPYSRSADGLAVLRSSIREFLCSEAMHHLGVPTTRALSLIETGELVPRDMFYNGNVKDEPGAVVCRVAPSFLRFGSFQLFAWHRDYDNLRLLVDYTIEHYFTHLLDDFTKGSQEIYQAWFNEVCLSTADLMVHWWRVGFVHGVMNTDNMSIHGLSIDYGPYGWVDNFDLNWTPNTTDAQNRRYRFGQQHNIALWNCLQLANAIAPLFDEVGELENTLDRYQSYYQTQWQSMMAAKLGVSEGKFQSTMADSLVSLMSEEEIDMTLFFRGLCDYRAGKTVSDYLDAFYSPDTLDADYLERFNHWFAQYQQCFDGLDTEAAWQQRSEQMKAVNPKYVFRNYLAQRAIDKAEGGDYSMIHELLEVFRNPYDDQPKFQHYSVKRPDWARTKAGCSMLSCSS